jgi:hypothetical protein
MPVATLTDVGYYNNGSFAFSASEAFVGTDASGANRSFIRFSLDTPIGVNDTLDSASLTLRFLGGTGTWSMRVWGIKDNDAVAPADISAALTLEALTTSGIQNLVSNVLTSDTSRVVDIASVIEEIRAAAGDALSSILFYVYPSSGTNGTYIQLRDIPSGSPFMSLDLQVTPAPVVSGSPYKAASRLRPNY